MDDERGIRMATFYIDYENVHYGGTAGIEALSNNEYVFLFYSQNANTMNMDTVKHFLDSRCGIEFVEADTGTTNALDFQLVTFLYSGIVQDDYHYIISKDHGFDAAVKMGNRMGIDNVKRFTSIMDAYRHYEKYLKEIEEANVIDNNEESKESVETAGDQSVSSSNEEKIVACKINDVKYRKMIREKIKRLVQKEANITLLREELEISCDGICSCDNKMKLYHFLRTQLGDKRGRCVYSVINEEFLDMKMELAV